MTHIIIMRGVHRNEDLAFRLAKLVADDLKAKDNDVELMTVRSLQSMIEGLHEGSTQRKKQFVRDYSGLEYEKVRALDHRYDAWNARLNSIPGNVLFDFHNYPEDPLTKGVLPSNMHIVSGRDYHLPTFQGQSVSWKQYDAQIGPGIDFFFSEFPNGYTLELPACYAPLSQAKQLHYDRCLDSFAGLHEDFEKMRSKLREVYFTADTPLALNQARGFLQPAYVSRLSALVKQLAEMHQPE